MILDDFVTIDFEASCLPRHGKSFPIEVAITGREGTASWLIRPMAGHDRWAWTAEASALHGIAPAQLERDGLPAHRVYAEVSRAIASRPVIADSPMDGYWWSVLAGAAGEDAEGRIISVGSVFDRLGLSTETILAAQSHADNLCPGRHRAADDARWLWTLLSRLAAAAKGLSPDPAIAAAA